MKHIKTHHKNKNYKSYFGYLNGYPAYIYKPSYKSIRSKNKQLLKRDQEDTSFKSVKKFFKDWF